MIVQRSLRAAESDEYSADRFTWPTVSDSPSLLVRHLPTTTSSASRRLPRFRFRNGCHRCRPTPIHRLHPRRRVKDRFPWNQQQTTR